MREARVRRVSREWEKTREGGERVSALRLFITVSPHAPAREATRVSSGLRGTGFRRRTFTSSSTMYGRSVRAFVDRASSFVAIWRGLALLQGWPRHSDHLDEGTPHGCLSPFPLESLMYVEELTIPHTEFFVPCENSIVTQISTCTCVCMRSGVSLGTGALVALHKRQCLVFGTI